MSRKLVTNIARRDNSSPGAVLRNAGNKSNGFNSTINDENSKKYIRLSEVAQAIPSNTKRLFPHY